MTTAKPLTDATMALLNDITADTAQLTPEFRIKTVAARLLAISDAMAVARFERMFSSAEVCLADARSHASHNNYGFALERLKKAAAYLVGIASPAYDQVSNLLD